MKDQIFKEQEPAGPFCFDQQVVDVFDDMIKRSVPGYEEVHRLQASLIPLLLPKGSRVWDLGCSTGKLWGSLKGQLAPQSYVGVDASAPMIERAKQFDAQVDWRLAQIQDADLESAGIVVLNYTLQFLPLSDREILLKRVAERLVPGGFLFLSEKIHHEWAPVRAAQILVHEQHKRAQGYSDEEIRRKRDALEDVLVPETLDQHLARLDQCGFDGVEIAYKWLNFCGLMAWRSR